MSRSIAAALLLGSLVAGGAPASAQHPKLPQVTGDITKLVPPVPTPASFVADVPGVVPGPARAAIDARIRALQDSGYGDIGVAILPSIADYQPYEVGLAIYRTWRIGRIDPIGSARRDLGVLLLIVPKELAPDGKGQCWISTGTGAEGIITDAVSGIICRSDIIPHLRDRDYGAAVLAGVEALGRRLRGDAGLTSAPADTGVAPLAVDSPAPRKGGIRWWHIVGGAFGGLFGIFGGLKWRRYRTRRCPKCGLPMQRLTEKMDDEALAPGQRMEEQLHSVDYDVWRCRCGETLVLPYRAIVSKYKECASCHNRTAWIRRKILRQPSYSSRGLAEDTTTCKSCSATSKREVSLPKLTRSSSGSGGGGSSGGDGSSFGGSGSSSGGGGGSSY